MLLNIDLMEIKDLRHCLICNTTVIKHLNKRIFMSKSKGYATHINIPHPQVNHITD